MGARKKKKGVEGLAKLLPPTSPERKHLFSPCHTKQELHDWVLAYLNVDLPDGRVDPTSNSSPMELLWEVYSAALTGDVDWSEIMAYASRDSAKTLSASILEILMLLHLERNVAHMAAVEAQAQNSQKYIKSFLHRPLFKPFISIENERQIGLTWYFDPVTKLNYCEEELHSLSVSITHRLVTKTYSIKIVICSVQGTNSEHVPFLCVAADSQIVVKGPSGAHVLRSAKDVFDLVRGTPVAPGEECREDVRNPSRPVEVLSINDHTGALEFKPVTRASQDKKDTITLSMSGPDDTSLTCSPDHPIAVCDKGYVEAKNVKVGDKVVGLHNNLLCVRVVTESKLSSPRWVYDYSVADNHNFFANSVSVHNCVDEVDVVVDKNAYHEAKMIPSPWMGKLPITLYISTRKSSTGLVQEEIDRIESGESDMQLRHWNLLDMTERCPTTRHLPEEPRIDIYVDDSTLRVATQEEYDRMPASLQEKHEKTLGYAGCLKNCKLYGVCRGRLADQTATGHLLKTIAHTTQMFRKVNPDKAKSQLLCWKPSKEALIYPYLDSHLHKKTAAEMAHMLTGDEYPETFGRPDLVALARSRECRFVTGIDHGYSHNFAVTTGFIDGQRLFMIDVISVAEIEIGQKIDLLERSIKDWSPTIWADPAEPGSRQTMVKHGFAAKDWSKARGSVQDGIDAVRMKIQPPLNGQPEVFFLREDHGCDLLFSRLSKYHWILDSTEKPTSTPEDDDDDECFTAATEVLTRRGWVSLADVTALDQILTVERTGESRFERPIKITKRMHRGNLYRVCTPHLEFTATPEHTHAVVSTSAWMDKRLFIDKKSMGQFHPEMFWLRTPISLPDGVQPFLAAGESPILSLRREHIHLLRDQTEMVYCVTTSTGLFMGRTNGKPFVAGNCDAFRYLVMNEFSARKARSRQTQMGIFASNQTPTVTSNWMSQKIEELTGGADADPGNTTIKKGNFIAYL